MRGNTHADLVSKAQRFHTNNVVQLYYSFNQHNTEVATIKANQVESKDEEINIQTCPLTVP